MDEIIDDQYQPQKDQFQPVTDYSWGSYAHLYFLANIIPFGNFIGAAIVWNKVKDEDPINSENAREALNYQITHTLGLFLGLIPALIAFIIGLEEDITAAAVIGGGIFALMMIWAIATLVFVIMGAVRASKGKIYRYPINISFVKSRFPDPDQFSQQDPF